MKFEELDYKAQQFACERYYDFIRSIPNKTKFKEIINDFIDEVKHKFDIYLDDSNINISDQDLTLSIDFVNTNNSVTYTILEACNIDVFSLADSIISRLHYTIPDALVEDVKDYIELCILHYTYLTGSIALNDNNFSITYNDTIIKELRDMLLTNDIDDIDDIDDIISDIETAIQNKLINIEDKFVDALTEIMKNYHEQILDVEESLTTDDMLAEIADLEDFDFDENGYFNI